jgi:hypothetical protein
MLHNNYEGGARQNQQTIFEMTLESFIIYQLSRSRSSEKSEIILERHQSTQSGEYFSEIFVVLCS